jgi:hypothetical protein
MRRLAIALLCALALSGCFESETPLFGTKDAVYPIASGSHLIAYSFSDKTGWKEDGRGSIAIANGWYILKSDDPKEKDTSGFILKQLGNKYIAMFGDTSSDKHSFYTYGLMWREGAALYEYLPACKDYGPQALKKRGLVRITNEASVACEPVNLKALETIMQRVLDTHPKSDSKFVIVK